jgi:hypothetical protein
MDDKTVNISSKLLVWTSLSIVFLAILIVALNNYNSQRKFNQFTDLNNIMIDSDYPERFKKIVSNFSPSDTLKLKLIKKNLGLLKRDYELINYAKIILRGDSSYYTISSYQDYRNNQLISTLKYLPKKETSIVNYLDNIEEVDLKGIYELSNDKLNNELILKISDKCYLMLKQYR